LLKEKVKQHDRSMATPLLTPAQIAKESTSDINLRDTLDQRVEEYLSLATTEWLPKAFPVRQIQSTEVDESQLALQILARVLSEKHSDTWLEDLLSGASSPGFSKAVSDLSIAVRADESGNNEIALQRSREAAQQFAYSGNRAGTFRAHVESIFAAHDAQDAKSCLEAAFRKPAELRTRSYRWLTIQFHIEAGTCYGLDGNLGEKRRLYQLAAGEASSFHYPVIYLRTQDHLSAVDNQDGNLGEGWARTRRGLQLFWSGCVPAMRGYNFYFNLYEFARVRKQPNLQIAAWRDGIVLSDSFSDYVLRAMAHSLMGSAAIAARQPSIAETEFEQSSALFAQAPQIKSTRIAHIEAETRLAEVDTAKGKPESAVARLRPYVPEVERFSDKLLGILFHAALGNAEAMAGNEAEAESTLRSALEISEIHLRSIHDDRSRVEWTDRTADVYRYFAQLRLLRGDSLGALEIWEWYRGAALRAGTPPVRSGFMQAAELDIPQRVAEALPTLANTTYISYALLPHGLAIWVYDNRGVFSRWVDGDPVEIADKADHFRALCADSRSDLIDVQRSGRVLYQILVAPIEPYLSVDRTLLIELDDRISGLPFDALLDPQNRYFSDRYTAMSSLGIYYQPDAQQTAKIREDSPALVVAVPVPRTPGDVSEAPLADAVSEGEIVARNFSNPRLLTESRATVSGVLSILPSTAIFHFAGHALSSPARSGLLLSDDLLNASSLGKIGMPRMQLAVFSACDTEDNSNGGAGGANSLVRAFLRAGAGRVVASRWNVDSRVTREFMDSFYRTLLAGNTVPGSIHQAQSMLRGRAGSIHPYYWSAFTAFGSI
jgi:CHAT domain-containing protein